MLQEKFNVLVSRYTNDARLIAQLWKELQTAYSADDRFFHNLSHIEKMEEALAAVEAQIQDKDTLLFSVFYHDVVYDVVRYVTTNDNEDQSAEVAGAALQSIGFPAEKIERCKQQIMATKTHKQSADNDTNFLIDTDLSILGQPWEVYKTYMNNIRLEYEVYPDNIYYAGRSAVLKNFLRSARLFKTDYFHQLLEASAKENIARELEIISLS